MKVIPLEYNHNCDKYRFIEGEKVFPLKILKRQDEFVLLSIISIIFLSIIFIFQLMSISYEWTLLLLNSYLLICFVLHDFINSKKLLSYGILFNGIWWLYTNIYIIEKISTHTRMSEIDYILSVMSIVSMLSFNVIYYLSLSKKSFVKYFEVSDMEIRKTYNFVKMKYILLVMLIVVTIIEAYVILYKLGIDNYIFASRAERSLLMKPHRKFMVYEEFLILITVISFYLKLSFKSRLISCIFYFAFINSVVNSVIAISRANSLMLVLPILFIAAYKNRISNKQLFLILSSLLILFAVWKGLLFGIIFNNEIKLDMGSFGKEFTTWYTIGNRVLNDLFENNIDYLYGKSFLDTLVNLAFPITNIEPLSVWYVKKYELDTYIRGGGRGFSGIVEGFLNLPLIGNIVYFMILGLIFKKINKLRYIDTKYLLIYSVSLPYIQRIFRSESYSLFKTWFWLYIFIIFVIFKVCEMKSEKKNSELVKQ